MRRFRKDPSIGSLGAKGSLLLIGVLAVPAAVLFTSRSVPGLDPAFESPRFHLLIVSGIAACALVLALAAAVVAYRDGRGGPLLLAIGCVCVGTLMLAHGLTTPGMLGQPMNMWIGRLGSLALIGFAFCLALATWHEGGAVGRLVAKAPALSLAIAITGLVFGSAVIVLDPTVLSGTQPVPAEDLIRTVLLAGASVSLLVTGSIHWRRWRLSRDFIELSLCLASWLAMSAILSLGFGMLWRLSWWDYHVYLLAGFCATAWAVVAEFRRSRSLGQAVSGISGRDPLEQISRGHPEALDTLIGAVEAKDPYTHGHSRRVAELSTRIGIALGLQPEMLRALHQGASLHDVGKISVPDRILNKPGDLTDEEWEAIKEHPVVGWGLAQRAPSLRDSLAAIRHHHERWDGSGYPDRLERDEIPLAGRIVGVADVWDALTSDRAYRPAWDPERAIAHIADGAGNLFDPECVEAFLHLMSESGLSPSPTSTDVEAAFRGSLERHRRLDRGAAAMAPRNSRRTLRESRRPVAPAGP
jgi:HD-GYP domain-containing protein (c-di-GMP phosphodiesterase class II)